MPTLRTDSAMAARRLVDIQVERDWALGWRSCSGCGEVHNRHEGECCGDAPMAKGGLPDAARRMRFEEGRTIELIAERLGVASSTVAAWCNPGFAERRREAARLTRAPVVQKAADERITRDERAVALYEGGLTAAEVAVRLGCSVATVKRAILAAGVSRPRGAGSRAALGVGA